MKKHLSRRQSQIKMIPSILVEQRHVCMTVHFVFCGPNVTDNFCGRSVTDTFCGRSVTNFILVVVNVCGI
jgi:hypothetical protein